MVKLVELLGNKNLIKILFFFINYPTIEIYQRDLQRKLKIAKATLIKWLSLLVKENILNYKKFGRIKIFYLNRFNTTVKYLKILYTIFDLKELKKLSEKYNIKFYLYGSCARGEDVGNYGNEDMEKSDVDILVIGNMHKEKLFPYIEKISKKINRKINIQIFSELQWSEMTKKDRAFYERIEKDKVLI